MSQSVIAIAEQSEGTLRKIAGEVCSEAIRLGSKAGMDVVAVTIGPGATQAAGATGDFGITQAVAVEGDDLAAYSGEAYAAALAEVIRNKGGGVVLIGATSFARDLLGRLGALLEVSPASDCVGLEWNGGLQAKRPVYAGKALLTVAFPQQPAVASLRPNVFGADGGKGASATVETVAPTGLPAHRATLVERNVAEGNKVDLTEAETIVSGGRGMKDPETFQKLIEPLAETLGAAIGASRAIVDAGWRPHSEQVGQTGKTVAPKLYIACGISGAIQHLAGMRTSQTIVAINKDPEAPIFKVADYGIVGDVEEVLPPLTEQVKGLVSG